jgi:hypothetical protein
MSDVNTEGAQTSVRMTVKLSPQAAEALKTISDERGITLTEALRRGISIHSYIHEAVKRGAIIMAKEPDGSVKELIFTI